MFTWRIMFVQVEGHVLHEPLEGLTLQPLPEGYLLAEITCLGNTENIKLASIALNIAKSFTKRDVIFEWPIS